MGEIIHDRAGNDTESRYGRVSWLGEDVTDHGYFTRKQCKGMMFISNHLACDCRTRCEPNHGSTRGPTTLTEQLFMFRSAVINSRAFQNGKRALGSTKSYSTPMVSNQSQCLPIFMRFSRNNEYYISDCVRIK